MAAPHRTSWRMNAWPHDLLVVRGHDVQPDERERALGRLVAARKVEAWLREPATRERLVGICREATGASDAVRVGQRLREAFERGGLVALRMERARELELQAPEVREPEVREPEVQGFVPREELARASNDEPKFRGWLVELDDRELRGSVLLPHGDAIEGKDILAPRRGLWAVLAACYEQAQLHPDVPVLVYGHGDGGESLARQLAAVLTGDREGWAAEAQAQHRPGDLKLILAWAATLNGWDSRVTEDRPLGEGLRALHRAYNENMGGLLPDSDVATVETFRAIFDLYLDAFKGALDLDDAALRARQQAIQIGEKAGKGVAHPIEGARAPIYRSQSDRRVEVLLFDSKDKPPPALLYNSSRTTLLPTPMPPRAAPPNALEVHLRLLWKDPHHYERPFPDGMVVRVIYDDDSRQRERLGRDGVLRFYAPRRKEGFTLRLDPPGQEALYVVSAPHAQDGEERLLAEGKELDDLIAMGHRAWRLPQKKWTLENSHWETTSERFEEGRFAGIEDKRVTIGGARAPEKLVLDPRWRYHQFKFIDRLSGRQTHMPPVFLEGYAGGDAMGDLTTRSNWSTVHKSLCHPWVLSKGELAGSGKALVLFRTAPITYVDTSQSPPVLVVSARKVEPGVERMRYYDLPELWKSRNYFVRYGSKGDPLTGRYQDSWGVSTSDGAPLEIRLDDMVLCSEFMAGQPLPVRWRPSDGVAIFKNRFDPEEGVRGTPNGLHRPDMDHKRTSFTQIDLGTEERNYISDYPNWPRLLITKGAIFDVFDARTADSTADDAVVGARAAMRMEGDPAAPRVTPFWALSTRYSQARYIADENLKPCDPAGPASELGKGEMVALRCCGVQDGQEVGVSLVVIWVRFLFLQTSELTADKQEEFVDQVTHEATYPWCDPKVQIQPDETRPDLTMKIVVHVMPVDEGEHTDIEVHGGKGTETWLGFFDNTEMSTVHHEFGHHLGHPDEYYRRIRYGAHGLWDHVPGGPYTSDQEGRMGGGVGVLRARYHWHRAEWLRSIYGRNFKLAGPDGDFRLPHHPRAPKHSHVNWPLGCADDASHGPHGRFAAYLYPLGRDSWKLPGGPCDGLIVVLVRMKVKFHDFTAPNGKARFDRMAEVLSKLSASVKHRYEGKFAASGSRGSWRFEHCALLVSPRFVVENFVDHPEAFDRMTAADYKKSVDAEVALIPGVKLHQIHTQASGRTQWHNDTLLQLTVTDRELAVFPRFFANMLGVDANRMDDPKQYEHLVRLLLPDGEVRRLG